VRFDNFLCAVDLDDRGVETLRAAGKLVATTGARLTIAHVVPGSESGPDVYMEHDLRNSVIEAARERLALMQKQAGTAAEVRVSSGSIARCIASTAREQRSDLVIIGRGGHGVFGRLRTHDYGIIRECGSPVLSL
jgi:nucleotide-binding universal stress UspA family protein